MQEEPLIPEKMMRYVKTEQNHVDKKMLNNPNAEEPRGTPRVQ